MSRPQSTNFPQAATVLAVNNTLNATPTGSTNTSVCRFNAAATVTDDSGYRNASIIETTTAADGTTIGVIQPGIYNFGATFAGTGAVALLWAISLNCAAAALTGDPALSQAGVLQIADTLGVAANTWVTPLSAVVPVGRTAAMAAGGALFRMHATNSGGAAPVGGVAAGFAYRLLKVCDFGG